MTLSTAQQRALTWLALAVAAALLLRVLGSALTPVILALVFAYLLWPMVRVLERRRVPRALAATITILVAMLAATVLVLLLVPIVTTVIPQLRQQWPAMLDKFNHVVAPQLKNFGVDLDVDTVKAWILKSFDGNMDEWGQKLLA